MLALILLPLLAFTATVAAQWPVMDPNSPYYTAGLPLQYTGQFTIRPKANPNFCLTSRFARGSEYDYLVLRECIIVSNQSWWVNAQGAPSTIRYAGWDAANDGPRPNPPNYCVGTGLSRSHSPFFEPSDGRYIELYPCTAMQGIKWTFDTNTGQFRLADFSQCIDVTDGRYQHDNTVQTWVCHDQCHPDFKNQQWVLHWDPEDREPSYPCSVWGGC